MSIHNSLPMAPSMSQDIVLNDPGAIEHSFGGLATLIGRYIIVIRSGCSKYHFSSKTANADF